MAEELKFSWEEAELKPEPAFTLRALLAGTVFGCLITIVNMYMGLTIGLISTAAMVSSLGFYGLSNMIWGGRRDPGPKEIITAYNVHQAAAFAYWMYPVFWVYMAQHAAFVETGWTLPDWILPNPQIYPEVINQRIVFHSAWLTPLTWMLPVALLGGVTGLMIASWFRYQIIEVEKLVFPYGMADAEVIRGVTTAKGMVRARFLFLGIIVGFIGDMLVNQIPTVWETAPAFLLSISNTLGFYDFTPSLSKLFPGGSFAFIGDIGILGIGMIMPPAASLSMGFGGILFYTILPPIMVKLGMYEWTPESASFGASFNLFRFPYGMSLAVGLMPTAAMIPIILQWKVFARGMRAVSTLKASLKHGDVSPKISGSVVIFFVLLMMALASLMTSPKYVTAGDVLSFPFAMFLGGMLLALMFLDIVIAIRMVGETGLSTSFVTFWVRRFAIFASGYKGIEAYAITSNIIDYGGLGTSQMESFRVGYLLKAKPLHQYVCALWGWTIAWLFSTFIMFGIWSIYGTGSEALPMPNLEAAVYMTIALATRQFTVLFRLDFVAYGVLLGVGLTVLRGIAPVFPIVPITFGMSTILGSLYSSTFMLGGFLRILLVRLRGQIWYEEKGVPFGAGLLAGTALSWVVAVAIHFLKVFAGG